MTPLETVLLSIDGAVLLALFWLWFWTKLVTAKPKTVSEAAVRALFYGARWLQSLAEAGDTWIMAYREAKKEPIEPHAERMRELATIAEVKVDIAEAFEMARKEWEA
jgi:hypothetical protein